MQVNVPGLDVNQANIQTVDLATVSIGPITVGDLVLSNTDVIMSAKDILLQDVTVWMNIHFTFQWNIHVGLPDGIPDIDFGATWDLGTLHIPPFGLPPIPLGNVVIPGLTNINLHIPTVTAQNMSVKASPLPLHLDDATADQIHATHATLPLGGFNIAGLSLSSIQGTAINVPDAHLDSATINHLHGTPIKISTFAVDTLNLPTAQIPHVSSTAPLEIPAQLPEYPIGFGTPHKSLLSIILYVKPFAHMHVGHLEITNADASATVGSIELHNVTLPYDVLNLTLGNVGLKTIDVPSFNVS